jgi:hypothetical protein
MQKAFCRSLYVCAQLRSYVWPLWAHLPKVRQPETIFALPLFSPRSSVVQLRRYRPICQVITNLYGGSEGATLHADLLRTGGWVNLPLSLSLSLSQPPPLHSKIANPPHHRLTTKFARIYVLPRSAIDLKSPEITWAIRSREIPPIARIAI